MGLRFSHAICDGLGAAQFLNAVGEIACGRTNLGVSPVWHRDFIPPPPPLHRRANDVISPPFPPVFPGYKLEHLSFDIPSDLIERFKHEFHASTGEICSAFEVIAACFWKLRTEAIDLRENTEVKLVFFANCRHLVNPPLPVGFYGNCFFPVKISAGSHEIAKEKSVFDVVKLIKQAKAKLPEEFAKFVNGDGDGDDPFAPAVAYTTLFLSEWGKLGFNQVDYGWGPPLHVAPIPGLSIVPAGIVGSMPLPKKGVRLMTWCVEDTHRQLFQDLMTNYPNIYI